MYRKSHLMFLVLFAFALLMQPALADSPPDITGVWTAITPGGSFKILSIPDRSDSENNIFIMLEPGDEEKDYGFQIGEVLATLTFDRNRCWSADEKFRLPLWAGGGSYMGRTNYCLTQVGQLEFSTDDFAAVYDSYLLSKDTEGIDAAGIWRAEIENISLDIILYPKAPNEWEAILLDIDVDDSTEVDMSSGDVLYRGAREPDSDGENAEAWLWGRDNSIDTNWLDVRIFLDDYNNLRIEIDRGPELGTMPVEFSRLY